MTGGSASKNEERAPLLPQYHDHQDASASSSHNDLNGAEGPSSQPGPSGYYGTLTANNEGTQQGARRARSDGRLTPQEAFTEFCKKGGLALLITVILLLIGLRLVRLEDLQQELAFVPQIEVQDYAVQGFTDEGVAIRVMGQSTMNYSAISGGVRRKVVKTGAKLVSSLHVADSKVKVYFDEEVDGYVRAVNAIVPNMTVKIGDGAITSFDFVTVLSEFGSSHLLGSVVQRLLSSEPLRFKGVSKVKISKGPVTFGKIPVVVEQVVNAGTGKSIAVKMGDIVLQGIDSNGVDISTEVSADYQFPVSAYIPKLKWDLKIPGCAKNQRVFVSEGETSPVTLTPFTTAQAEVRSHLSTIPQIVSDPCGPGLKSPLDDFVSRYLGGLGNTVTVAGSSKQSEDVPRWMLSLINNMKFDFDLPGKRGQDDLIKGLEISNFKPERPDGMTPHISATIIAMIEPPPTVSLDELAIAVHQARGIAELHTEEDELFAEILIREWSQCETTLEGRGFQVKFRVEDAPVNVTNQELFEDFIGDIFFKRSAPVIVRALVDARVGTPLGNITMSEIPANGHAVIKA